jgi:hypothetical protein
MVSRITEERTKALAAEVAQAQGNTPMATHFVERLDTGNPYFLVILGEPGSSGAIVTVDAVSGTIASSAQLERIKDPWLPDEARAAELAECKLSSKSRLVWRPSRASLSPFYPLWELTCESGLVFIDYSGKVWRTLPLAGPGTDHLSL